MIYIHIHKSSFQKRLHTFWKLVTARSTDPCDPDEGRAKAFNKYSNTQIHMPEVLHKKRLSVWGSFGYDVHVDVSGSGMLHLVFDLGQANAYRKVRDT
jgi:hypothetical protein